MAKWKVGIIGCGRPWRTEGATGFGMGHRHALAYKSSELCDLVAAADIKQENLDFFLEQHEVPRGYLSADEMLEKEDLDIVSVTLWPHLHAPMVIKAAEAGVKAIHCEKPMATAFGDAKKMVEVCKEKGVQLTFNHQRRFGEPFNKAKELLDAGAIGDLLRVEAFTSNLYDWGTHWFDLMFMYNDETPADWVMGQIDARGGKPIFGAEVEGQGMSLFQWKNGVMGLMVTRDAGFEGVKSAGVAHRLMGTAGTIEVGVNGGPEVRLRNAETGGEWQEVAVEGGMHGNEHHIAAVADLAKALKEGRDPVLAGWKALQSTELIFATYESSRRRARVDLPLDITDSPYVSMLEAGELARE